MKKTGNKIEKKYEMNQLISVLETKMDKFILKLITT